MPNAARCSSFAIGVYAGISQHTPAIAVAHREQRRLDVERERPVLRPVRRFAVGQLQRVTDEQVRVEDAEHRNDAGRRRRSPVVDGRQDPHEHEHRAEAHDHFERLEHHAPREAADDQPSSIGCRGGARVLGGLRVDRRTVGELVHIARLERLTDKRGVCCCHARSRTCEDAAPRLLESSASVVGSRCPARTPCRAAGDPAAGNTRALRPATSPFPFRTPSRRRLGKSAQEARRSPARRLECPACFASMTTMPNASRCSRREGMQWIAARAISAGMSSLKPRNDTRPRRSDALARALTRSRYPSCSGGTQPVISPDDVEPHIVPSLHEHTDCVEQQVQPLLRNDLTDVDDPSAVAVDVRRCRRGARRRRMGHHLALGAAALRACRARGS